MSILTPEIIRFIQESKLSPTQLSRKLKLSRTTIYKVLRQKI